MVLRNNRGVSLIEVALAMVISGILIAPVTIMTMGYVRGTSNQISQTNKTDSDNIKMFKIVQEIRDSGELPDDEDVEVEEIETIDEDEDYVNPAGEDEDYVNPAGEDDDDVNPAGEEGDGGHLPTGAGMTVYKITIGQAVQYVTVPREPNMEGDDDA